VRLVLAVIQSSDVDALLRSLTEVGISATQIEGDAAVGKHGLAAVIAGVEDEFVADVVTLVHATARARSRTVEPLRPIAERAEFWVPGPIEQQSGGASVYVLPVRRFERMGYA
jgi:uncharacterized protein YaaQ